MVNRDDWNPCCRRGGLREGHPDEQRTDEPRALSDRNCVEIAPPSIGVSKRLLDDATNVPDVLTRGELRDYASPLAVNGHLRRDDVRPYRPGPQSIVNLLNDGGRCFVAGGFDAENTHRLLEGA